MPRVSAAFFALGTVLVLIGMIWGEIMGAQENFLYAPVHAHLNLLGWTTLALYGTFYALTKESFSPRLAWANFWLSGLGAIAMAVLLTALLTTNQPATYGPLVGAAGLLALLGLVVFMVSVWRELMRSRT